MIEKYPSQEHRSHPVWYSHCRRQSKCLSGFEDRVRASPPLALLQAAQPPPVIKAREVYIYLLIEIIS